MRSLLVVAALALVVVPVLVKVVSQAPRAESNGADGEYRGGRLDSGRKLRVLRLAGSPKEKGRAHGHLLKSEVRAWLQRLAPKDPGLRDFAIRTTGERMLPQLPAAVREEIEGLAEGAGIEVLEALFLNTRFELGAHGLVDGSPGRFEEDAVVAPGPEVFRRLAEADLNGGSVTGLFLVVHEDTDPPLVMVTLPGVVGGLAGVSGGTAATLRPMRVETRPVLTGVPWPILVRALLEEAPTPGGAIPLPVTRAASVPMVRPDGEVGTLNVTPGGGTWYPGFEGFALSSELPVTGEDGRISLGRWSAGQRLDAGEAARRVTETPPFDGIVLLRLRAGPNAVEFVVETAAVRLREVVRWPD